MPSTREKVFTTLSAWVELSGLTRIMMVLSLLTAVFSWEYLEYSAARAGAPMLSSRMQTRTNAATRIPFFIDSEIPFA